MISVYLLLDFIFFIFLRAEATVRLSRFHSANLTFHMFFLK